MPTFYNSRVAWVQKRVVLRARPRGFHLITDELEAALPELASFETGLAHFFLQHTSASLTVNENADPDVRADLEDALNALAPEDAPYTRHTAEGSDDMPAHVKASLLGCEVTVPVAAGRLALGTWQGITLGEHRDHGGARAVLATLRGKRYPGRR